MEEIRMNPELSILISRLKEAGLSTKRFVKLGPDKVPLPEANKWEDNPWDVEDLNTWPCWGVAGREGLVLVDCDIPETQEIMKKILPPTFEVITARRKLTHFYFKVEGDQVPNAIIKINGKGAGEIRAQNHYLVAPGVELDYIDKKWGRVQGTYRILNDQRIAEIKYDEFMKIMDPYIGIHTGQRLTIEHMRNGVAAGERHAIGIRYATFLIGVKQFDYDTALFEMKQWNNLNAPPMVERDLVRMVKNAIEYVATNKNRPSRLAEPKQKDFTTRKKHEPNVGRCVIRG